MFQNRSKPYIERSLTEQLIMLLVILAPFIATLYAIVHFWQHGVTWKEIVLMLGFYWITGIGVTIGYHRMLTHRSFQAHPAVRFLFLMLGGMAFEGTPQSWAALHLMHHKHSDGEKDPHSPLDGFWHAHVGWLTCSFEESRWQYGRWMDEDKLIQFFNKTSILWMAVRLGIPYLVDGWNGFIWGGLVAMFLTHHVTWAVNSASHTWGQRPFKTTDASTNLWWVGILAFGEGWHNNHHAYMWSARHGLFRGQVDVSYYIIRGFEGLGKLIGVPLVWNVLVPTHVDITKRLERQANHAASAEPEAEEAHEDELVAA
jgi:stearoyl-CoA desaturase (Delta-9 desaturase)